MPAVPSWVIDPLWEQFHALIPPSSTRTHWSATARGFPDRVIFDKLIQVLVFGAAYAKIADHTCSATTLRTRRDEWITAGVFAQLEQLCLVAYDQVVGLELVQITVDGCLVKAPCGDEAARRSPVDRGKLGTNRSVMTDAPASRSGA